jgi:hypothetical protein
LLLSIIKVQKKSFSPKKIQTPQNLSIAKIDHKDSKTISNLCNLGHIFCASPFIKKLNVFIERKKIT